jgi:hypothetical protein
MLFAMSAALFAGEGANDPAGVITLNVGGIIKKYSSDEYKVEKIESVCYEPKDPCLDCKNREKKLIEELHKTENKYLRSYKPQPVVKTETVTETTFHRVLVEGVVGYGEDGIITEPYPDIAGYNNAETYNSVIGGVGMTFMLNDRFGVGIQGQFGEISRAILGKVVVGLW